MYKASQIIDSLYKKATITVPDKKEIEKEKTKVDNNFPTIVCENCGYKGKTTEQGECPQCMSIGGIKHSPEAPKMEPLYDGEPKDGIGVYEADELGNAEVYY